jgi:gamma-glutamylcyclotransferase
MTDTSDTLLCFSYGSNMSTAYLRETCPGAAPVTRAELANHRIEFRRFSNDLRGGLSTIMPAPGEMVPGVLFHVPRVEIEALDLLEDVDKGLYRRETHLVLAQDATWRRAELYRVARPRGPFAPSPRYVGWMIAGAKEHGLNPSYIEGLQALLK